MKKTPSLDRRSFLKGGLVLGAAGVTAGLAGCAPTASKASDGTSSEELSQTGGSAREIAETIDVDVVVVGAGNAGMPAAVEAAEQGAKTLLLEKAANLGGNGVFTFGPCGFQTRYSKASGIDLDYHEVLAGELNRYSYRNDIRFFMDMAEASSGNIEWVADHGVAFADKVDNYKGGYPTMHYFAGEDAPGGGRTAHGANYIAGMQAAAEKAGVEIMTSTPAVDILQDESGAVTGVVAERSDGTFLQVNASAVILATGGWNGNPDMMRKQGRGNPLVHAYAYSSDQSGDGWAFATKAGAHDLSREAGYVVQPMLSENIVVCNEPDSPMFHDEHPIWKIVKCGIGMWVNDRGERFVDEALGHPETGLATWATNAIVAQKRCCIVIDQAIADDLGQECMDWIFSVNEQNTKVVGETLDELAANGGFDADILKAEVERYNSFCAAGVDGDFGKRTDALVPLSKGPYYAFQLCELSMCSFGGVRINRSMQALDSDWNEIPGLYVIGVDSLPFYQSFYYFNMPGSAIAFEIHSGLVAARHAVSHL